MLQHVKKEEDTVMRARYVVIWVNNFVFLHKVEFIYFSSEESTIMSCNSCRHRA